MRPQLRRALRDAMKGRDAVAVSALRSALAAIDNAEAVDGAPPPPSGHADIAGSTVGLRATEVERRSLSDAEVVDIVRAEVSERLAAARDYERSGHLEQAERLRGEADVLKEIKPAAVRAPDTGGRSPSPVDPA